MPPIFYRQSAAGKYPREGISKEYERNRNQALINPVDIIKPIQDFPDICITTFSKKIIDKTAALMNAEVITNLVSANGLNPIYRIRCAGRDFALYCSRVGAPASVCEMEEVIAMGADKFVFFGSCGVLNDAVVRNRIIVPSGTVRDEGTSYHYAAPEDDLVPDPKMNEILQSSLEELRWPYVTGKIWTTDAIYRETIQIISERKEEGCIAVDMEYSALLAAARFRNIKFIQFFFGADSMNEEVWHSNDLTDYGISNADNYMKLAVSCGLRLSCA